MERHILLICTTLLLLVSSALSQSQSISLKNADFNKEHLIRSNGSNSTPTVNVSTTATIKPSVSNKSKTTTPLADQDTSTSAPWPTTMQKPQPYPAPTMGSWNCSCIMLNMAAQLNFTYETKTGNMTSGLYNIPSNATVDHCYCNSQTTQSMQINWGQMASPESLVLQMESKNNSIALTLIKVDMMVPTEDFPDAKENQTVQLIHMSQNTDLKTPEKMSYHCTRVQKFNMTETFSGNETLGTISVSHVQVESFRNSNNTGFSTAHDCDSSATSDVVPIAVGIALTALIMVVLISYLCARRRSTSRGYMSF